MEDAECLSLTVDNLVLVPTSSRYHLANCGGNPRLQVVVGTRWGTDAVQREPVRPVVAVGEDKAAGTSESKAQGAAESDVEGAPPAKQPRAPGPDSSAPTGDAVDVEAHVEVALARIVAAACERPSDAAEMEGEGKSQERQQRMEGTGGEEDERLDITDAPEAHEIV